jgi:hypothetical protein
VWGHAVTRRIRCHGPVVDARGKRGGGERCARRGRLRRSGSLQPGERRCGCVGPVMRGVPGGGDAGV